MLPFLFICVATMGTIIPTATNLAMLNHPEAAGAGSALLGGAQYAVGGLAGPLVTLAGDSAAAMSIGMAIAAAGAFTAWHGIRPPATAADSGTGTGPGPSRPAARSASNRSPTTAPGPETSGSDSR